MVDLLLRFQQLIWLEVTDQQNFKSKLEGLSKKKKKKNLLLAIFSFFISIRINLIFPGRICSDGKSKIKTEKNCLKGKAKETCKVTQMHAYICLYLSPTIEKHALLTH